MSTFMIRVTVFAIALTAVASAASAQGNYPRNDCTDDAMKLCPTVKPGEGRVIACLVKDKSKLSAACIKLLTSRGDLK